jgi:predicted ABC-type ATPase
MIVVAGPPGSGKTTALPTHAFGVDAFNIDDRCAALNGSYVSIGPTLRARVGRECEAFISDHISAKQSFAVETTLRTLRAVEQAHSARAVGFETVMYFLCTSSADAAFERVRGRANSGGHGAHETIIRGTYEASIANLADAIDTFEVVRCFDSSRHGLPPFQAAIARNGKLTILDAAAPEWLAALSLKREH